MKHLERLPSTFRSKVFDRLFQAVDIKRFNREDMDAYYRFWFAEMDREDMIQTARKEGHFEGVMATARNMKADGLPAGVISKYTGLTAEQVEAL